MIRLTERPIVRIGIASILMMFCYAGTLARLVSVWSTNARYSYGLAVPLIAGYVVWTKWPKFRESFSAPDYRLGGALIVLALAALMVGWVGALTALQEVSLLVALAGLVAMFVGRPGLRALWFPLAYLLFMLPIWDHAISWLQGPSQEFAALIATKLLRASGLAALQQGTTIVLATVSLEVMAECSGINQLLALTTMAVPAAYLWLPTRTRQITLIAIAVLVGYFCNGVRVALLGWLTVGGFDVKNGHGLMHLAPGFLTAAMAYLVVGASLSFLTGRASKASPLPAPPALPTELPRGRRLLPEGLMVVLMLGVGTAQLIAAPFGEVKSQSLSSLPSEIGEWVSDGSDAGPARFLGFDINLTHVYPNATGQQRFVDVDDEILRTYRNTKGQRVQVYVGYYESQADGRELSGDLSQSLNRASHPLTLAVGPGRVTTREIVQEGDEQRRGVIFWYDINGRTVSNIYLAKGFTLVDAFTRRRTNGAAVIIAWDARNGFESDRQEAIAFAERLLPLLRAKLPS